MEVKQIFEYVNGAFNRAVGTTDLTVAEDLSNIVEVGEAIFNANANDNFVKSLVDRIGRTVFVNRIYKGDAPSVLMSKVEYGSVTQKIQGEMPEASENEDWELEDGAVYEQDQFYASKVSVKYFNGKKAFEIDVSITDMQLKESFLDYEHLDRFLSMIENNVSKAMTVRLDQLIHATICNFIAETINNEYQGTGYDTKESGIRAVNILKLYKDETGDETVTTKNYLTSRDFIRFATATIEEYVSKLRTMSTLFNLGGKKRFTDEDNLHTILLDKFKSRASTYLSSDTFHNELVALPKSETVAYWQGTGKKFALEDISKINVKTSEGNTVVLNNILGVMFDHDGLGVRNEDPRVTSHYNAKAEFTNFYHKWTADYFNDFDENFVVFFVA